MKEIITINDAKTLMLKLNVIIYGTIRDIEQHFFTSFSNLENMSKLFNKSLIIIFENDSSDNTRGQLIKWSQTVDEGIEKHIILKNDLITLYPLRAHRLAYCRNCIINYIYDNNYHHTYDYAIHCDLDNRFWSINYDSIATSFQYDLTNWDVMTCVNKNKTYYDFWALRCDKTWFNINIFSCDAQDIDYNTKTEGFENLLKNATEPIETASSFNGLGIYKLKTLICCRYNADYFCNTCKNANIGCKEDNDHIGLHKQMVNDDCKIFINNKMYIQSSPANSIPYETFIESIKRIQHVNKHSLLYLLINNLIDKKGKWIMDDIGDGYVANIITNYYNDSLYAWSTNTSNYTLLNKNIVVVKDTYSEAANYIFNDIHNPAEYISFIYIDNDSYQTTKHILHNLYNKIQNGCIIMFKSLLNDTKYYLKALKALYEFTQEYEIEYDWYISDAIFHLTSEIIDMSPTEDNLVSIKITKNPCFNVISKEINFDSPEYVNFDWIFYTTHYNDLSNIKNKEDAFLHWKYYGKYEGRISKPCIDNTDVREPSVDDIPDVSSFDWEVYLELNVDLKEAGIETKEQARFHWLYHGIKEGRLCKFDWCTYVKNYNLLSKSIDNKIKAINHWLDNGKPEINMITIDYQEQLFDWKYYIEEHKDLKQFNTPIIAWNHWITYGKKEGRKCHNFNWTNYLLLNSDLIKSGIDNEMLATEHWINHGRKENRKYISK